MSKYFYNSKNNTRHFRMLFLFTEKSPPQKLPTALKVHERVVDFLMSLSEGLMEAEKSNSIKGGPGSGRAC